MPQDHASNLVFIHIPKNAGKFIEDRYGLSSNLGAECNQPKRSFISNVARSLIKLDSNMQSYARNRLAGMIDVGLVGQHLTLCEMQLFGLIKQDISSLKLLCSVRHPYTRMLSIYCHIKPHSEWSQNDFESFAENWIYDVSPNMRHNILAFKRTQTNFIRSIDGNIPPNLSLVRVETLEQDLQQYERLNGITNVNTAKNENLNTKSIGISKATSVVAKRPKITNRVKEAIIKCYRDDFDILGYDK